MLSTGIKGNLETTVTSDKTAKAMGSGSLEVYATPAMIALMEETSYKAVEPYLEDGQGTVGTRLEIDHVSPSPIGMKIKCESVLVEIDRKKLVFEVEAYDEAGLIGKGRHERFIIDNAKFQGKCDGKLIQ